MESVCHGGNTSATTGTSTEEYQVIQRNFSHIVTAVTPAVGEVAIKSFEKNLITKENMSDAQNSLIGEGSRVSKLLRQILDKIELDKGNFYFFVSILQSISTLRDLADDLSKSVDSNHSRQMERSQFGGECSVTDDLTKTSADSKSANHKIRNSESPVLDQSQVPIKEVDMLHSSIDSSSVSFQCCCGSNCSLHTSVSGECRGQLENLFPYLDVNVLAESDKCELIRRLVLETNEMINKFEDLEYNAFKSLKRQEIATSELIEVALAYGRQSLPRPLCQADHKKELSEITTISDIHIFLTNHGYISFFNYRILEKIIRELGTADDKHNLDTYLDDFIKFCKRRLFEVPASVLANSALSAKETLVVKVNENVWFGATHKSSDIDFTLQDMYAVGHSIAKVIGLCPMNILIKDVRKGCIQLTFVILPETQVMDPSQLEELSKYGIRVIEEQKDVSTHTHNNYYVYIYNILIGNGKSWP